MHWMVSRARVMAALCLAVVFIALGCGSASLESATETNLANPKTTDELQDFVNRREEAIQRCMKRRGFEYRQQLEQPGLRGAVAAFGIVSSWTEANLEAGTESEPVKGNDELLGAMTATEVAAWEDALFGAGDTPGCSDEAEDIVQPLISDDRFDRVAETEEKIRADPRSVALDAAWSLCMTEAGFIRESQSLAEVAVFVTDRLQEFERLLSATTTAQSSAGSAPVDDNGETVDVAGGDTIVVLTPSQQSELDDIAEYEQLLAAATFDCLADKARERQAIRDEYERGES